MSADRCSLFYCLTESGWQPIRNEDERVEGWAAISEVEVYQGSPFGRTSCHPRILKTNPEVGSEEVKHLKQQFPIPDPLRISPNELKHLLDRALNCRETG